LGIIGSIIQLHLFGKEIMQQHSTSTLPIPRKKNSSNPTSITLGKLPSFLRHFTRLR
jgi:hypothetical protein